MCLNRDIWVTPSFGIISCLKFALLHPIVEKTPIRSDAWPPSVSRAPFKSPDFSHQICWKAFYPNRCPAYILWPANKRINFVIKCVVLPSMCSPVSVSLFAIFIFAYRSKFDRRRYHVVSNDEVIFCHYPLLNCQKGWGLSESLCSYQHAPRQGRFSPA